MSVPSATPENAPHKPIFTAHLFPKLDGLLLDLLRSLSGNDWEKQTVSPKWKVKDVAAHLLDTALRGLSLARDSYFRPAPKLDSRAALGAYIDRLNAEGVAVYGRLSPAVLIALMEIACRELAAYHPSRDPFAQALFGVSWAGEEESANWFDTAREFTERWHHQQQIRLALDPAGNARDGILTRELYFPVLDCFMRALPFTYRNVLAAPMTAVRITVAGECGGSWCLLRGQENWELDENSSVSPAAEAVIPQEIAWRIFTKGISREAALEQVRMTGDSALALPALGMISIVSA